MTKHAPKLPIFLGAISAFVLTAAAPMRGAVAEEIPLDEASIFLELNDTDGDLGIHALVDGDAWKRLKIKNPKERTILDVNVRKNLRQQGLTELFFESAEPSFDELSPDEFLARFPEGEYEFEGRTLEGDELEGEDELTHVLPARPHNVTISGHAAPEACDDENSIPTVGDLVTIAWDAVTESHPEIGRTGELIEVVKYQLVVEREEPTLLVYSVDLPPSVTELEVPEGFIALGEEFKFEILVREVSGNQTALESCFKK